MIKHKHAELIIAWANGNIIECYDGHGWYVVGIPTWKVELKYRVQCKPKPDIVHEVLLFLSPYAGPLLHAASPLDANCVLVFDGETNKLKQCTFKGA